MGEFTSLGSAQAGQTRTQSELEAAQAAISVLEGEDVDLSGVEAKLQLIADKNDVSISRLGGILRELIRQNLVILSNTTEQPDRRDIDLEMEER